MKVINARIHGMLDYVVVAFLLLAPTLFGLSELISMLSYALGGIHLMLTLLTDFPAGVFKVVPLKLHGMVELVVGIVLIASPLYLKGEGIVSTVDQYFFAGFGAAVLVTWLLSDYQVE